MQRSAPFFGGRRAVKKVSGPIKEAGRRAVWPRSTSKRGQTVAETAFRSTRAASSCKRVYLPGVSPCAHWPTLVAGRRAKSRRRTRANRARQFSHGSFWRRILGTASPIAPGGGKSRPCPRLSGAVSHVPRRGRLRRSLRAAEFSTRLPRRWTSSRDAPAALVLARCRCRVRGNRRPSPPRRAHRTPSLRPRSLHPTVKLSSPASHAATPADRPCPTSADRACPRTVGATLKRII